MSEGKFVVQCINSLHKHASGPQVKMNALQACIGILGGECSKSTNFKDS